MAVSRDVLAPASSEVCQRSAPGPSGTIRRSLAACTLALWLAACGWLALTARAAPTVKLLTSFTPERLGASTTIGFGFQITGENGQPPVALTAVDLNMPGGLNYVTTTLGLAICRPATLLDEGPGACSPNSRIGSGSAYVEVPFGEESGGETAEVQAFMGPPSHGNIVVLFYASGASPVSAQLVFPGELVPGYGSLAGALNTGVPLIPSVPGGSDVSIRTVHTTIGPGDFLYTRRVHGKIVHFRPRGVALPETCPRGGFRFSAWFDFADGSTATANSTVACPHKR
jgi:hypothetical protein